jgi:hydrogenase/urease accessory protein HupE
MRSVRSAAVTALAFALVMVGWTMGAYGHPLSFGLLELRETAAGQYEVLFRFSGTEQRATGAEPVLPDTCRERSEVRVEPVTEGGETRRWSIDCGPNGLAHQRISIRGMEQSGVQILVRLIRQDATVAETMLGDIERTWTVPARENASTLLSRYFQLGVHHIATGTDHLAFVLGLMVLAATVRRVLAAVTAFTLGHSVTLACAVLGIVRPATEPIEAAIALSIVLLAVELLQPPTEAPTLSRRFPWAIAGAFGLLHGFGFAGALMETGLPRGEVGLGLLGFNAGVEAGQLAFVLACALIARLLKNRVSTVWIAYPLGIFGSYWCIARLVSI